MKKQLLLLMMMLLPLVASAYDAQIDGIYYRLKKDSKTAEVTFKNFGESNSTAYSGDVVIPSEIMHDGIKYRVDSIGWNAFSYCSELTSISIPEGVTTIGYAAFSDCTSLNKITIPNSIIVINQNAFLNTPLVENQPDGVVYLGKYAYIYKGNMPENTQIELDDGTLGIADCAFIDSNNLTSITTPSSLSFIGFCAFARCSNLTVAKFGSGLKTIGSSAFAECGSLFSVEIPNGVISIDGGAFSYCNSLTSVIVPNSVSYIGGSAFQGCSNLTSLEIPDGVRSIEEHTFYYCSNLAYVTIPQSVTSIGNEAFYNCSSLAYVNIPTNVASIGYQAFYGCKNVSSIVIPNGVTKIEDHTFYDCSGLSSVLIPNGITSIGRYAFAKCSSLKSIIIPPNVANIGESAFMNCWGLGSVNISDISSWCNISFDNEYSNPTYYAKCLYINESKLSILKDLSNISKINKYVFINCIDLTSASLPNDITIIGEGAFRGCTKLTKIDLPEELKIIQKQAFSNCCELKKLVIPSKVELIYQEAFSGCNNLELIKALPTTPPFLYDNSFSFFSVPVKVPKGCKQAYQSAQGWKNFTNISDADKYKLIYIVDNIEYKSYDIEEGETITPEVAPTKEGYTFSGWSEIPETMPAHDVTVTGTFSINSYKLTYMIDDKVYKETMCEYGATITPEPQPEGDYQTFEWTDLPQTMPAHDVVVHASYTSGIIEVLMASQHNVRIYSPNGKKLNKLQKGLNIVIFDDGTVKKVMMK